MSFKSVEIVLAEGSRAGVLSCENSKLKLVVASASGDWPYEAVPTANVVEITPGHTSYVIELQDPTPQILASIKTELTKWFTEFSNDPEDLIFKSVMPIEEDGDAVVYFAVGKVAITGRYEYIEFELEGDFETAKKVCEIINSSYAALE